MEPTLSSRKLSHILGVPFSTVQRILKHHKCHNHRINTVQELNEDENDWRLESCEVINEQININHFRFFLTSVFFLMAKLTVITTVISEVTIAEYFAKCTPAFEKLNVRTRTYKHHIVGPFIYRHLNTKIYVTRLKSLKYLQQLIDIFNLYYCMEVNNLLLNLIFRDSLYHLRF